MLGNLWHDSRLMSLLAGLLSLIALCLAAFAIVHWAIHRPVFDLKTIEITGQTERVNLIGFENQVVPKVGGSFFSVDLLQVRRLVESQPWIRKAVIQRAWPNGLKVSVEAHKPLALWGESQMVNTYGEVFSANLAEATELEELARLEGPLGSELLVSKMFTDASASLNDIGLHPVRVTLSDRYGWMFQTEQGIRIELGREQEDLGIEDKLARLKRIYPSLSRNLMSTMEVIDMRYPRGLAVKGKRLPENEQVAG
ncbi:MAG: cell division protein FtsQ/DivIB [Limnobacter sp.]|nr:cell division protein FtsQ/DivIB [Limnobacter sp.]